MIRFDQNGILLGCHVIQSIVDAAVWVGTEAAAVGTTAATATTAAAESAGVGAETAGALGAVAGQVALPAAGAALGAGAETLAGGSPLQGAEIGASVGGALNMAGGAFGAAAGGGGAVPGGGATSAFGQAAPAAVQAPPDVASAFPDYPNAIAPMQTIASEDTSFPSLTQPIVPPTTPNPPWYAGSELQPGAPLASAAPNAGQPLPTATGIGTGQASGAQTYINNIGGSFSSDAGSGAPTLAQGDVPISNIGLTPPATPNVATLAPGGGTPLAPTGNTGVTVNAINNDPASLGTGAGGGSAGGGGAGGMVASTPSVTAPAAPAAPAAAPAAPAGPAPYSLGEQLAMNPHTISTSEAQIDGSSGFGFNADTVTKYGPVGVAALGLGGTMLMGMHNPPGYGALSAEAAQARAQGAQLESYAQTGTLPPGMHEALQTAAKQAATAIRANYAKSGMSGSSAEAQDLANLQLRVQQQGEQIAQSLLQQGIQQTQLSSSIYGELMQTSIQQDQMLAQGIGNFATALASMGRPIYQIAA